MRTITIEVSPPETGIERAKAAFRGEYQGEFLSFVSHDLMLRVLTPKRWEILRAMLGHGAMSIRELARRLDRDVKAVHGDVQALLKAGVLDKTEDGRIEFPYDAIHVDFTLDAANAA